jgi:hypothetical protein
MPKKISMKALMVAWPVVSAAASAGADPLSIGPFTIDGGGASGAAAGSFTLSGTIGQPEASVTAAGPYVLRGGFWTAGPANPSSVGEEPATPPQSNPITELRILHAAPNPARRTTQVRLELPAAVDVSIRVYDPRGALVRTLVDRPLAAGRQTVTWDGLDHDGLSVGAGIYFLRVRAGRHEHTQKVAWIR